MMPPFSEQLKEFRFLTAGFKDYGCFKFLPTPGNKIAKLFFFSHSVGLLVLATS
jgi:hypothetical protein